MSQTSPDLKPAPAAPSPPPPRAGSSLPNDQRSLARRLRLLPVLATVVVALLALGAIWILWQDYMGKPWTRDGTVRADIVTLAPEVSGRIAEIAVRDNQFVRKGELLMKIDQRDFQVAVDISKAAVDQAQAEYENRKAQRERRLALSELAASAEERQTYASAAEVAAAKVEQEKANLERANINLARTEIRSPVNGWVTNLLVRQGDYAITGQSALALIDKDSFWVDGYFEETALPHIQDGAPAKIWLLGYGRLLQGHVDSVARGIVVHNATPGKSGLATVDPIFTWVRLAQRIPVRIHLGEIPPDIRLVIGMTATIEVEPGEAPPSNRSISDRSIKPAASGTK